MNVQYKTTVAAIGRNGCMKQTGLDFLISRTHETDVVVLSPINSKGDIGNCSIDIPRESIIDVLNALTRIYIEMIEPKKGA